MGNVIILSLRHLTTYHHNTLTHTSQVPWRHGDTVQRKFESCQSWERKALTMIALCRWLQGVLQGLLTLWIIDGSLWAPSYPAQIPAIITKSIEGGRMRSAYTRFFFFFCASVQHLQRPVVGAQEFSESDSGCDGDATRVRWLCQFWTVLGIFTRKIF